ERSAHIRHERVTHLSSSRRYARGVGRRSVARASAPPDTASVDIATADLADADVTREAGRRVEVFAVFGPTASGKSAVAEAAPTRLGTRVFPVDGLRVSRGLPILTNQPAAHTRLVGIR